MQRMTVQITGMSCGHCVAAVKVALATLPDVQVEEVKIGQAVVSFAPGGRTATAVMEAIADAGYEAYETP